MQGSPISLLPPEILSHIFNLTQEDASTSSTPTAPYPSPKQYQILSSVCRLWRNLTTNSPLCWTNISITPFQDWRWAELCIQRSGSCNIDLVIEVPGDPNGLIDKEKCGQESGEPTIAEKFAQQRDDIFELIRTCASRCRTIRVAGDYYDNALLDELISIFRDIPAPALETFAVEGDSLIENGDRRQCCELFGGNAANLAEVRLGGYGMIHTKVPMKNTRILHLAAGVAVLTYTELKSLLEGCSELTTLCVYDDLVYQWPAIADEIHLPNLKSLQIYGNMRGVSQFLMSIDAPQLEDLVIAPVVVEDLTKLERRISAGTASPLFPQLKSLTLAPAHAPAFQTLPLAAVCFPSTSKLTLVNFYQKPFIDTFIGGDILWPKLETLCMRKMEDAEELLLRVVAHRKEQGAPLKRVCVDNSDGMKQLNYFKTLVEVVTEDDWNVRRKANMFSEYEDRFMGTTADDTIY